MSSSRRAFQPGGAAIEYCAPDGKTPVTQAVCAGCGRDIVSHGATACDGVASTAAASRIRNGWFTAEVRAIAEPASVVPCA